MDNSSRKSTEEDIKDMSKVESTDMGTVSDALYAGLPIPHVRTLTTQQGGEEGSGEASAPQAGPIHPSHSHVAIP